MRKGQGGSGRGVVEGGGGQDRSLGRFSLGLGDPGQGLTQEAE